MEYWSCTKCEKPFLTEAAAKVHYAELHEGMGYDEVIEKVI